MTGQDPVAWLRHAIRQRLYLAQHAIELGNAAEWTELSSGVLVTGPGTENDSWHGTWPMGDSSLTRLMEANDPRDTIARCEAELAILDLCEEAVSRGEQSDGRWHDGRDPDEVERDEALASLAEEMRALVASGYKHWPGWREEGWETA